MQTYLNIAIGAAKEAGLILKEGANKLRSVNAAQAHDIKLQADVDSEKLIRKILTDETGFPVVGEELGGDASLVEGESLFWVVDPLDGTHNYLRRVPVCGVSIALMKGKEAVLGVFYDFNCDECFSAIVADRKLYLNGEEMAPQWAETIDQASLHTGFPVAMDYSNEGLSAYFKKVQAYKKVRAIGSAATALAWVACGRFDAYYEEGSRLWDIAAGIALIQAAGGIIEMTPAKSGKTLAYDVWGVARKEFIIDS